MHGVASDERRCKSKEIFGLVGCSPGFEPHDHSALSGGMKQAFATAYVLLVKAKMLLMDELIVIDLRRD